MRNWLVNTQAKEPGYYKGILIHADLGVHEQAAELFQRYVSPGFTVLDIGAGAGAFSLRLQDLGYQIAALDVYADEFVPQDIPIYCLDVDHGMRECIPGPFDAVCCLEVIEHLENPWNLLREIHAILRPGGYLLLSTPNVTSFLSRWIFLRTGQFHMFGEESLAYGHIAPITAFELSVIAERVGFRVVEVRPGGYLPVFALTRWTLRVLFRNFLRGIVYLLAKGQKRGWCLFFVMRKDE